MNVCNSANIEHAFFIIAIVLEFPCDSLQWNAQSTLSTKPLQSVYERQHGNAGAASQNSRTDMKTLKLVVCERVLRIDPSNEDCHAK